MFYRVVISSEKNSIYFTKIIQSDSIYNCLRRLVYLINNAGHFKQFKYDMQGWNDILNHVSIRRISDTYAYNLNKQGFEIIYKTQFI